MDVKFTLRILLLLFAVIAASGSATFFEAIEDASGPLKAAWRLQLSGFAQIPLFIYEWKKDKIKSRSFVKSRYPIVILSGLFLAGHFSLLAISVNVTSIAHAMCFTNSTPILAVIVQMFTKNKPSALQIFGILMSFSGLLVMVLNASDDDGSTVFGDILGFLSGICILCYLYCGKYVRSSNVLWVYVCPINLVGSIFAYIIAISIQGDDPDKIVEWIYTRNGLYVLYLGLMAGFVGHATFNYLLKTISPILVTTFGNFTPPIASIIGWLAGFQEDPTLWTWVGGSILICGNVIATLGEKKKEEVPEEAEKAVLPTNNLDELEGNRIDNEAK